MDHRSRREGRGKRVRVAIMFAPDVVETMNGASSLVAAARAASPILNPKPDATVAGGADLGAGSNEAGLDRGHDARPSAAGAADDAASDSVAPDAAGAPLTEEEKALVEELKARDREVRAHEQAHARVGGQYAGAPRYEYQVGPDGKRYAVGGSVSIDVAPIPGDPEATIQKMEQVKAAALAPAEPSAADRKVAARADQQRAEAQAQLIEERAAERRGETNAAPGEEAARIDAATGYAQVAAWGAAAWGAASWSAAAELSAASGAQDASDLSAAGLGFAAIA